MHLLYAIIFTSFSSVQGALSEMTSTYPICLRTPVMHRPFKSVNERRKIPDHYGIECVENQCFCKDHAKQFLVNKTAFNTGMNMAQSWFVTKAFFGVASQVFMANRWIAYADIYVAVVYPFASSIFQFLISINELTAAIIPLTDREYWRYKNLLTACVAGWIISSLVAIPTVFMQPAMVRLRGNVTYIGNINVVFVPTEVEIYDLIFVGIHHVILAMTMIFYAIIYRAVQQSAVNSRGKKLDNIPHSLRQCTKVAGVISICTLVTSVLLIIPFNSDLRMAEKSAFYTFIHSIKSTITPLSMLIFFPKVKLMFLERKTLPYRPK